MARLTTQLQDGGWAVPEGAVRPCAAGYAGEAIERLARFENLHGELLAQQEGIAAKLEALRGQGKERSAGFRELLGRKMMNNNIITLLGIHDLL